LWVKKRGKEICIGYDNRFMSPEYAEFAAGIIQSEGVNVDLSGSPVPTPCVSHRVKNTKSVLGIAITASHNKPEYNGFKIKEKYGGSASAKTSAEIIGSLPDFKADLKETVFKGVKNNWIPSYMKKINEVLPRGDFKVACDFMYGTGSPYFENALREKGHKVIPVNNFRDPLFGGRSPEPKLDYLHTLVEMVRKNKADIAFAFDGDADRIALIDERGRYLSSQAVLALLAEDLLKNGGRGKIVVTVAGTYLAKKIARRYGVECKMVPIGFKNICPHMLKGGVLVAGEESGGIGFGDYLPERDALYTASRLIELSHRRGKKIGLLWDEIRENYADSVYLRKDIAIDFPVAPEVLLKELKNRVKSKSFPFKILDVNTLDGIRITIK
ncbi:MAG: hypothetical protein ACQESB_05920, partial [Elusimicrobiota bacterium]